MRSSGQRRSRRVLIAKVGLDGHEAGAKLVAMILVEAGYEVIYGGARQTPAHVVAAAEQEDVDLVGISLLSGAHLYAAREVLALLREKGLDVPVIVGGVIPPDDRDKLLELGVAAVFGPGSQAEEIVTAVNSLTSQHR